MAARVGITHAAWPGGLAMMIETPTYGAAAVFEPQGWRFGHPRDVLPRGAPEGAQIVHLALPEVVADQLPALQLVGSGLHTDFVHLDRLVARLRLDGADTAIFVLGRAPAVLVISGGQVTVLEPAHEPVDEVLTGADGWIVVGLGRLNLPAAAASQESAPAAAPSPDVAPPPREPEPSHVETAPPAEAPPPIVPEPALSSDAAVDGGPPAGAPEPPGAFGRFAADTRFVLAPGAAERLPADASAQITEVAGEAGAALMALMDGAHTLSAIAAATGLPPGAVASVVEILSTHRLVFKYVSRVRPPTSASAPG